MGTLCSALGVLDCRLVRMQDKAGTQTPSLVWGRAQAVSAAWRRWTVSWGSRSSKLPVRNIPRLGTEYPAEAREVEVGYGLAS